MLKMWIQPQKGYVKPMSKGKLMITGNMEEGIKFHKKIKINTNHLFIKNPKFFMRKSMIAMKSETNTNLTIKLINNKI